MSSPATPRFRVVALAAGRNAALLAEQAHRHRPAIVALGRPGGQRHSPRACRPGRRSRAADALAQLATRDDVDLVVVGTGGVVSLRPVLAALEAGKMVATANKETLVAGGHLVMPLARRRRGPRRRRPGRPAREPARLAAARSTPSTPRSGSASPARTWRRVDRLILTASGGPFLDLPAGEFAAITPQQALRHPTWSMGAKITIDSATLANKGLEVVEARWLCDLGVQQDRRRDPSAVVVHFHRAVRRRLPEGTDGAPSEAAFAALGARPTRLEQVYPALD